MGLSDLAYAAYERRLAARLPADRIPRHVGVILDGNRRWARDAGASTAAGHRAGADRIDDLLGWCEEFGVEVVTLWLLSTDNLARSSGELDPLLEIIVATTERLALPRLGRPARRINVMGALDLLPEQFADRLAAVDEATAPNDGLVVNVAVGYGGRREIADAVRSLLAEQSARGTTLDDLASELTVEHIAEHLYTRGQPDPDLVIRTSGEQRLSGFLLWQSAHSEFYFCEAYWPDFRRVDFLRALRDYAARNRRFGG